ncbi:MAG: SEC-C metal-binding domain-containing protein [Anaerovoracaceae bacterium]
MTLFEQWQNLIDNQTDETFEAFWKEYSETEVKIYTDILENHTVAPTGTFQELVDKYEANPVIFMGFLDGINTSLSDGEKELEKYDENTQITLNIDFEKLFFNMLAAEAEHLYGIPAWEKVFPVEKLEEIVKTYKKSKTVVKEKEPGRNDPCPCGSGKKYKKCCGANK